MRDAIIEELDAKLPDLVEVILGSDLDYSDQMQNPFHGFCFQEAMLFAGEVTRDEFRYIIENIQVACAVQDLVNQGKVVKEDGVYRSVDDGQDHHCSDCG